MRIHIFQLNEKEEDPQGFSSRAKELDGKINENFQQFQKLAEKPLKSKL